MSDTCLDARVRQCYQPYHVSIAATLPGMWRRFFPVGFAMPVDIPVHSIPGAGRTDLRLTVGYRKTFLQVRGPKKIPLAVVVCCVVEEQGVTASLAAAEVGHCGASRHDVGGGNSILGRTTSILGRYFPDRDVAGRGRRRSNAGAESGAGAVMSGWPFKTKLGPPRAFDFPLSPPSLSLFPFCLRDRIRHVSFIEYSTSAHTEHQSLLAGRTRRASMMLRAHPRRPL